MSERESMPVGRVGWFCAKCGRLVGYGEQRPKPDGHVCESPYKDDRLPIVGFPPRAH